MYWVIYRERDTTTVAEHESVQALPTEDVELGEVVLACRTYHIDAALYDAAGFSRGWIHADGSYSRT